MTSKFFAAGNASSDSDESDDQTNINKNQRQVRNLARDMSSSESDDDKRKVVGEKEKKWTIMRKLCQKIKDKLKINDFIEIFNLYQELLKEVDKAKKIISTEGYPSFYMKTIINLIEVVNTFEGKKTLNVVNSRSFTTLKQKLKKHEKEFEEEIEKFKTSGVKD